MAHPQFDQVQADLAPGVAMSRFMKSARMSALSAPPKIFQRIEPQITTEVISVLDDTKGFGHTDLVLPYIEMSTTELQTLKLPLRSSRSPAGKRHSGDQGGPSVRPAAQYEGFVAVFVQFADPATWARVFERIVRSLKPSGVLILPGYTPKQLEFKAGRPSIWTHLHTREMLESAFSGMSILEMRDDEAEFHKGTGHSEMSALVGVVARK